MAKSTVELVDVGGSFRRLLREAPKEARRELSDVVKKTVFKLEKRMQALAPDRGPDPPHIKDSIESESRGMSGKAGILDRAGSQSAGAGSTATLAEVAIYNEYRPNEQEFMRPAARLVDPEFTADVAKALQRVERSLGSGVGI
jgi:hypothetical protein